MTTRLQAAALVDGAVDGDPRDEDAVVAVNAVALADVESQRLARTLHYLHERGQRVRVLKKPISALTFVLQLASLQG